MIPVAIVGAGISGIACARKLAAAGVQTVIFDKGRGIGGRVATRRAGNLQFDHGAQYVTAHGASFSAALRELEASGAVTGWDDGSGHAVIVGTPGMSSLPKALAAGLDVRVNAPVISVTRNGGSWIVQVGDKMHRAARVVVTVPAPQVAGLIGADHPLMSDLASVRYAPSLTLMAAGPSPAPIVSRRDTTDPLSWIAQDSTKPGRAASDAITWVAQASPEFSKEHLELDMEQVAALMLPMLSARLGLDPEQFSYVAAHRWRYAAVTAALGQPFLRSADATLHLGGDWCIGPRVEAAWTSGIAIADDILSAAV